MTARKNDLESTLASRQRSAYAELEKTRKVTEALAAKREAAQRYDQIMAIASCKPTRARIVSLSTNHPGWDNDDVATIACRRIRIGMTAEQVRAAWGRPDDINRSVYSFGIHEQWVWEDGDGIPYQFAYMEDGVLTSTQQ